MIWKLKRWCGDWTARAVVSLILLVEAVPSQSPRRQRWKMSSLASMRMHHVEQDGGREMLQRSVCSCGALCSWTRNCCDRYQYRRLCGGGSEARRDLDGLSLSNREGWKHGNRLRRTSGAGEMKDNASVASHCADKSTLTKEQLASAMSLVVLANGTMEKLKRKAWLSNLTDLLEEIWSEKLFLDTMDPARNGNFCTVPMTPVMAKSDHIEVSFYLTLESGVAQVPWLASVLHRVQSLRSLLENQLDIEVVELTARVSSSVWEANGLVPPTSVSPPTVSEAKNNSPDRPASIETSQFTFELPAVCAVIGIAFLVFFICRKRQKAARAEMSDYYNCGTPRQRSVRSHQTVRDDVDNTDVDTPAAIRIIPDNQPAHAAELLQYVGGVLVNQAVAGNNLNIMKNNTTIVPKYGPVATSNTTTRL